jgi:hypothetical protein
MFFDLSNLSKKQFNSIRIIFELIHILLLVVGPSIVVCTKYKIFEKTVANPTIKLTGVGIILVVILGLYFYTKIMQTINKFPEIKLSQQRIKFTIQMLFGMLPVGLILIGLILAKDNVNLAFDTAIMCLGFILIAKLFDGLCLKYVHAELTLREEAAKFNEIQSRRNKV